jgi:NDP-sugar pyrophosphorylase family protein
MKPTLLILAAGIGSRYGGLKQADPMGPHGETIIDYSVYDAIRAGFGRLVCVIRREIEPEFKELIASRFDSKIPVEYAYQEMDACTGGFPVPSDRSKPWGTAHAVLVAEQLIDGPFAAINADDFYGATSFRLLADHLHGARDTSMADYSMVGFMLRNTLSDFGAVSRGVCKCDETGRLRKIVEITNIVKDGERAKYRDDSGKLHPLSGSETVSMNTWAFTPSIFDHMGQGFAEFLAERGHDPDAEYFLPTVVNTLVAAGRAQIKVMSSPDTWFGVTYPEDKAFVARNIRKFTMQGEYPEMLWG